MKLVSDARFLWRRWSTRIAGFQFASVLLWWTALPEEWKSAIPSSWLKGAVLVSGAAFVGAQLVVQPKLQQRIQSSKQGDDNDKSQ